MSETPADKITFKAINAIGCGKISMLFMRQGIGLFAIPFFQMFLAVDPFLLSIALTAPIFIALFLGPFIGNFSDYIQSKYGSRKILLLLASLLCGLSYGLLWMAPVSWQEYQLLGYIFLINCVFQIFSSVYVIPLTSMCYEVSKNPVERTKLIAYATYYHKTISLLYHWAFPLAQLTFFSSLVIGVQVVGWGIGILFIFGFGILPALILKDPESKITQQENIILRANLWQTIKMVLRNKVFVLLMILVVCQTGGVAFAVSFDYYLLVYFMADGDLAQGAILKSALSTAYSVASFAAIALVPYFIKKNGFIRTLKIIFIMASVGGLLKWWLFTPEMQFWVMLDAVFCCAAWVAMGVVVSAILANVCDDSEQQNQADNKGVYIALHNLMNKSSNALALVISGLALNWIGFDAQLIGSQPPVAIEFMRLFLSVGTFVFSLLAYAMVVYMGRAEKSGKVSWA